ncbi:hypothetical protein [Deinococcus sonorensis]|uniref:Peptidase S51 n=2 Tax=Deinococcus sonorensis TaxID=309891 RepID=A0AAU7U4P2_9DEIO
MDLFLFGGGWRPEAQPFTYRRFVQRAGSGGHLKVAAVVAVEPDTDPVATFARYAETFSQVGVAPQDLAPVYVSATQPLTAGMLLDAAPTAVFVCGGLTPLYQAALCHDLSWLRLMQERHLPYGGFSAGAAIAADQALVGGWQVEQQGQQVAVAQEEAGEDLDLLTIRPGLGLVPFAVEVHATQWGTLSRLIHAVHAGLVESGWAIDEDTLLEVSDTAISVHGLGSAYRVTRGPEGVAVSIRVGERALTAQESARALRR